MDKNAQSRVKFSFQYSTARSINSDEEVIAEIMRNSETNPPLRVEYKKKQTEVYMHTLNTKDTIYFLWENKTPEHVKGGHGQEPANESGGIMKKRAHKHRHRDRAAETTLQAKYMFRTENLQLVNADKDADDTWSFTLPGSGAQLLRKMSRADFDKPGTQYSYAFSAQFKFIQ